MGLNLDLWYRKQTRNSYAMILEIYAQYWRSDLSELYTTLSHAEIVDCPRRTRRRREIRPSGTSSRPTKLPRVDNNSYRSVPSVMSIISSAAICENNDRSPSKKRSVTHVRRAGRFSTVGRSPSSLEHGILFAFLFAEQALFFLILYSSPAFLQQTSLYSSCFCPSYWASRC